MTPQEPETTQAIEKLIRADDDTLLEQLGLRLRANASGQAEVMELNPSLVHDAHLMGPLDDLRDLGGRIFRRWNRELFKLVCGGSDDDGKDRESVLEALGLGDVALGGVLATILIGSFGVAPAVATVVGALIVRRLGSPAAEEICGFWEEKLGDG